MKLSDFHYDLPPELIAQEPLADRTASRLLQVNANGKDANKGIIDGGFQDILELIQLGDLLVFNDTRVIPARLFGIKETGGKVEVLVERVLDDHSLLAHIRASKSPKPDSFLTLEGSITAKVLSREGALFKLQFTAETKGESEATVLQLLEQYGHIPLPPYIERADREEDKERYQTVFAAKPGAVAAPTAGLHFDNELLQKLQQKGVATAKVTLHVGAGTFQPVKTENLSEHIMHAEYVEVSTETCEAIEACHQRGGRVVAVGTTTVRSLESACMRTGELEAFSGDTQLFITPGYSFKAVDVLVTNFHLPGSTLLMLVSAFSGYDNIFKAYSFAVENKYRFFSYGDAMFLTKQ